MARTESTMLVAPASLAEMAQRLGFNFPYCYDETQDVARAFTAACTDTPTNFFTQQIGRTQGRDIVQEGLDPRAGTMRRRFCEIEPMSFHWTAERSVDNEHWRTEVDIRARRI
jgi:hypothetical protein